MEVNGNITSLRRKDGLGRMYFALWSDLHSFFYKGGNDVNRVLFV